MLSKKTLNLITTFTIVLMFFSINLVQAEEMKTQTKLITVINGIEEYELPNGLKVLLKPNNSIPLITFSIWYKVGSRNEIKGEYGLAHFLEHMMFKGTKKLKKGEISSTIQGLGGVYNAFTSSDGTAYYETISPKYLEKVIEIESDRIKNSLLDQNELNLERTVVLSELEGDLNNPATYLDQEVRGLAYDLSPYKHPTIGYVDEVKNINSELMRNFYKRYYTPNNATIVLVGDFNKAKALSLINKHFKNIKNDNIPGISETPKEPEQKKEKRTVVKKAGSFKLLEIVYHACDTKDPDIYPLNIVEEILIKGEKSPLQKKLIEAGLATEVYGGTEANHDPGLFQIVVSLTPQTTHKQAEKIILTEINKLIKSPPSEKEIQGAINRIKASYLFGLDGTYNQALNIGYFELINNWKQSQNWTKEIEKVKAEDITRVLKKYLQKNNRTIGYFIPKLQKGEKYEPTPINLGGTHNYTKTDQIKDIKHNSDYSQGNKQFKYEKVTLQDNSELLIYKNIDLPVTYISGVIKGGSSLLPKEKEWYCQLISMTLEKGSKNYTKEKIEELLDETGSQINFSCNEESFKFTLATINENLSESVDLLLDLLMNPTFPSKEIEIEKKKTIAETNELKDNPGENASRRFTQIIYPSDHPYYANSFSEDVKLIKQIDSKNSKKLKEIHNTLIRKNNIMFSLVSNIKGKDLKETINQINKYLNTGEPKKEAAVNIPDTLLRENLKTETIFLTDKMQSDVYLGHAGNLKRTDPDFYKMNIANYILGGSSLASRLSKRVRDNAGLTYTIYSYFNSSHGRGEFAVYFGSNNNNVDKAIELTKDELTNFVKTGITEEELRKAKASLIDSFVSRNLSTYRNISNTIAGIEFYDLGDNYINDYPKIINSLKLSEINSAIKKYIHPDKLNIVVAGEYKKP